MFLSKVGSSRTLIQAIKSHPSALNLTGVNGSPYQAVGWCQHFPSLCALFLRRGQPSQLTYSYGLLLIFLHCHTPSPARSSPTPLLPRAAGEKQWRPSRHNRFIGCAMGSTRRRLSIQGSLSTGLVPRHDESLFVSVCGFEGFKLLE